MSVIREEELQEIVEVVCMTALELPIGVGDSSVLASCDVQTSEIEISGAWQGAVRVRASIEFLTHAASKMFNCPSDEVSDMDRADSLTELTNMLGGTVKCLLPEPCNLSLPIILTNDLSDTEDHEWENFECEGRQLAVAVTQKAQGAQQAA